MTAADEAPARSYLLVRRAGSLWGLADAVVEGRNGEGAYRIRAGGEPLSADEILTVVEGLRIVPPGSILARWWPEPLAGLAVHGGQPLVVIDRERPPRALRSVQEAPPPRPAKAKGRTRKAEKGRPRE